MVLNSSILMRGEIWQYDKSALDFKASVLIALSILFLLIAAIVITLWLTDCKDRTNNICNAAVVLIAIGCSFVAFNTSCDARDLANKEVIQPASLTEIKDFIKVKDNKLTIEPVNRLPRNSKHFLRAGVKDENQNIIFKIEEDQFYETMSLASQGGEKFELSKDEIQMIKEKRQQSSS